VPRANAIRIGEEAIAHQLNAAVHRPGHPDSTGEPNGRIALHTVRPDGPAHVHVARFLQMQSDRRGRNVQRRLTAADAQSPHEGE
jgi:hypothetical protein